MNEYNGLKIGDIITAYYKGYWKITRFENTGYGTLVYSTQVADSSGKPRSSTEGCCHSNYCKKLIKYDVTSQYVTESGELSKKYQRIYDLAKQNEVV